MPIIDLEVVLHKLNVDRDMKLIKQKKIMFNVEQYQAMCEEVENQLEVKDMHRLHRPRQGLLKGKLPTLQD